MRRTLIVVALAALVSTGAAYAQEGAGAGRLEVSAFPGGGLYFSSSSSETNFGNYAVGGALGANFNRWLGVEGEIGHAVGIKQTLNFNGETLTEQRSPSFLAYNANVIVNPIGSNRTFVPYATGGMGGLRLLNSSKIEKLGVTNSENYLTGNVGGGLKWFAGNHWGARADYRLMVVNDKTAAPEFFGHNGLRYGHRIYGGLLFTN
jgi:hypothetical protein